MSGHEAHNRGTAARPRSLLASTVFTYCSILGYFLLSFGNVLILSRALGPVGRGEFVYVGTVAQITAVVATVGVQQALANIAARRPGVRGALATNSVILAAVLGMALGAVVYIVMSAFPGIRAGVDLEIIAAALAAIPILVLGQYLIFLVRADYAFAAVNIATLLTAMTTVAANGVMTLLGLTTVGTAVAAWIGGQVVGTGILVWVVARRLGGFGRPDAALARESLWFGLKSHPGGVMLMGNFRLDQWLVGAIAGSRELGLYSIAVAWTETLFYLPTALGGVLRPDFSRAARAAIAERAMWVVRVTMLVSLPAVVVMILAAPFLCVTLFGADFAGSVDDLRVLAPGVFGIIALRLLGEALTAQNRPLLETAAVGTAFVATVTLDLLLIPAHGGLGAAIASTLAYSIGGLGAIVIFTRAIGGRALDAVPRAPDATMLWNRARGALSYERLLSRSHR